MNKTLSLVTIGMVVMGANTFQPTSVQAHELDCVNHWINPETKVVQCFDGELNYMAMPDHNLYHQPSRYHSSSDGQLRRRSTEVKMVMPNLVGKEIDLAEDFLLGMGVNLGSEPVHAHNKATGEIVQQSPLPGTKLTRGQTVLLKYMGATTNLGEVK